MEVIVDFSTPTVTTSCPSTHDAARSWKRSAQAQRDAALGLPLLSICEANLRDDTVYGVRKLGRRCVRPATSDVTRWPA
jgi:hypothetical protein